MFYLGIDVSKAKLDCYLLLDQSISKGKSKVFANTTDGMKNLLIWLTKYQIQYHHLHVVMEATGVYHDLSAFYLYDSGCLVSIANPAHVKYFGKSLAVRTKTDKVDSQVLARYGALIQPSIWTPPSLEARVLQELLTRRDAIMQDLQREKNRHEKAKTRVTIEPILLSIKGSINFLQNQLNKIHDEIDNHINHHPTLKKDLELLRSIPAIGKQTSMQMLAIFHVNTFNTAEQLAAYLGLVPVERRSGSSVRGRLRLSKTGPARVRAVLYMAAIVATHYNPTVKALYERLQANGKCKMLALGAAMRKLIHLCFGVLKTQKSYQVDYHST